MFGWLLAMLGQQYGFPVPVGGSGELAAALARRATAAGAELRTGEHVERVEVRGGRAVAVHTATGLTVRARRAVIADIAAPMLYRDLLPADALPQRLHDDLEHFVWDTPVVKVNWALDGPIPWRNPGVAGRGHRPPRGGRARDEPVVGRHRVAAGSRRHRSCCSGR